MATPAAEPLPEQPGVSLSGSGWSCALSQAEAKRLAVRLELEGQWSLAYKLNRSPAVSLDGEEKRGLLGTSCLDSARRRAPRAHARALGVQNR